MLGRLLQKELDIIKNTLVEVWGDDCIIESVRELDGAPYPIFEIKLQLYKAANVLLRYEAGILSTQLKIGNEYIILRRLTEKEVYFGFEVMKPEIMQHNFRLLDEVVKKLVFGE